MVRTTALLSAMRVTEAWLWPEPFAFTQTDRWAERYQSAFTHAPKFDASARPFEWDGDRWQINVVGHSLFGSEVYIAARSRQFGWMGSLAFTAVSSTVWEYGFEANGVQPSGVDLWFTPLAGLLLGEARFQAWKAAGTLRDRTLRITLQCVVDPFGEIERRVVW